ncbi:TRAP transporter small permease [Virgibacillus kekensis]|uniref:TRAP transporter small permease n=1 Tax=Virgibacillus kekensis TaxID=202261 RepID=A0ABV9DHM4_9BACI
MKKINSIFDKVERASLFISKCGLFAMMVLVSSDAIGRYFFNSPIVGTYEFVEMYLMMITIFLSMSYVMKIGGHIRLDIVIDRLAKSVQMKLNFFYYLIAAVWMFFIGYYGMQITIEAWAKDLTQSGIVSFPLWLSYIWVPIGAFLFSVRLILLCINMKGTGSVLKGE